MFVHATAIAFWAGALMPLASLLSTGGPDAAAALRRFSRLIPYPIGALVIAGVILAVIQVQSPEALVTTSYGRVLIAKLSILAVLFALAMRNRWRLTAPALGGDPAAAAALARSIRLEIVLVCAVFAVAALWRFTPPPRVLAIEAALPASVHIHADKAMAEVTVSPGRAGPVAVSIFVMNGAFDPLPAKEVTLVLSNPAAGIEPIKRPAKNVDGDVAGRRSGAAACRPLDGQARHPRLRLRDGEAAGRREHSAIGIECRRRFALTSDHRGHRWTPR